MLNGQSKNVKDKDKICFTVFGKVVSKANSRRLFRRGRGGAVMFAKSADALIFLERFRAQCPKLPFLMSGSVLVIATIYYPSRRSDLDESLVLDAMQGLIYENDRQVRMKKIIGKLDAKNPRVEICVKKLRGYNEF